MLESLCKSKSPLTTPAIPPTALPPTKVKLFVGDKFSNGDLVNVYYYDKDTKELDSIHDGIQVQEGYITFDIEHCSEYFVTRANIGSSVSESKGVNVFLIISIVELVVIIGVIVFFVVKIKSMNKSRKSIKFQ